MSCDFICLQEDCLFLVSFNKHHFPWAHRASRVTSPWTSGVIRKLQLKQRNPHRRLQGSEWCDQSMITVYEESDIRVDSASHQGFEVNDGNSTHPTKEGKWNIDMWHDDDETKHPAVHRQSAGNIWWLSSWSRRWNLTEQDSDVTDDSHTLDHQKEILWKCHKLEYFELYLYFLWTKCSRWYLVQMLLITREKLRRWRRWSRRRRSFISSTNLLHVDSRRKNGLDSKCGHEKRIKKHQQTAGSRKHEEFDSMCRREMCMCVT